MRSFDSCKVNNQKRCVFGRSRRRLSRRERDAFSRETPH
jgi:hypothetical protein